MMTRQRPLRDTILGANQVAKNFSATEWYSSSYANGLLGSSLGIVSGLSGLSLLILISNRFLSILGVSTDYCISILGGAASPADKSLLRSSTVLSGRVALGELVSSSKPENSLYFFDRKRPRQHMTVSSLQQQSPQQSPFFLCIRRKSFTNHGENIVRKAK